MRLAPHIDLDERGALQRVTDWRPDHVPTLRKIWGNARYGCSLATFARAVKAAHGAQEGHCSGLIMTSQPPKQRISFKLDGIRYSMTVPLLASATGWVAEPPPIASGSRGR